MFKPFIDKIWKRFLLAAITMLWFTATLSANEVNGSFLLAGALTTIILIVLSIGYGSDGK